MPEDVIYNLDAPPKPKKITHWGKLFKFSVPVLIFFGLQYLYQIYVLENLEVPLIRASALTGATLIAGALFTSVIFKFVPRTAQHWRYRRYLGVWGVFFGFVHYIATQQTYFPNLEHLEVLNPLDNPVMFAVFALPIFLVMAFTSTDWMMNKLTPRVWKFIHRFVYVAFLLLVFHFILVAPDQIQNIPGYLLLGLTAVTILGHVYLFFKVASSKGFRSLGTLIGFIIILGALTIAYLAFK